MNHASSRAAQPPPKPLQSVRLLPASFDDLPAYRRIPVGIDPHGGSPDGNIRGALNVGCTPDQILEIILQMAVYAGLLAALEAVKSAATVFGESKATNR